MAPIAVLLRQDTAGGEIWEAAAMTWNLSRDDDRQQDRTDWPE